MKAKHLAKKREAVDAARTARWTPGGT